MTNRIIETEYDREMLCKLIDGFELPFTVTLTKGKRRSVKQNRTQRLWLNEIAEQLEGHTAEEWRGYCKLTLGVPIMRENEAFCQAYDKMIKGLPYEHKLAMMMEPLDMPVTRIMTTKQKAKYLDEVARHFADKGVILTDPEHMMGE